MAKAAAVEADTGKELCCTSVIEAPLSQAEAAKLAGVLSALADPVRLRLLSLVAAQTEVCSCDLEAPLAKSRSRSDRRGEAGPMDVVAGRTGSPRRDPSSARRLTGLQEFSPSDLNGGAVNPAHG